jgi:hypothetical protein
MNFYEWHRLQPVALNYATYQIFTWAWEQPAANNANNEKFSLSPAQRHIIAILSKTEMVSCGYLRKRIGCQYLKSLTILKNKGLIKEERIGYKKFFSLVRKDENITVAYAI